MSADSDLLSSRLSPEDEEKLTSEQRHADLLERVIKFGLNQSQHLIEVQVDIFCNCCRLNLNINKWLNFLMITYKICKLTTKIMRIIWLHFSEVRDFISVPSIK